MMDVAEYQKAVIDLFKSGQATDAMWAEMAATVLYASENHCDSCENIDKALGLE